LAIGKTDGEALGATLAAGPVTLTLHSVALGPERDGDVDNTVVAHEWGHYLHHRLASCDIGLQCGGMSEGWGDFNALLMMLREGDNRSGSYALAPYAADDGTFDAAYFGLRRFPYSTDTARNALRFRHIADASELPTTTPLGPGGAALPNSVQRADRRARRSDGAAPDDGLRGGRPAADPARGDLHRGPRRDPGCRERARQR
jgi:hypothetical protein